MTFESVLTMLGGIGLFLYGMKLLGQSLERIAGSKMEKTLERLTNNRGKGILLGTGVTAVIQSSSATIIMVMGFINAGIMRLEQAVPVILGANIGTTVTAQILRLGDVYDSSLLLQLVKPTTFAPICVVIGAFVILIAKKAKVKDKAGIAIGLGILFIGMKMMESSFEPLCNSPAFGEMMVTLTNPMLGLLAGIMVTVLLQSSSASVGVLQALSVTGVVTYGMMFPIVIGQNIGKCITVVLASIGTTKETKRAVATDVMGSLFGGIVFMIAIYTYQNLVGFSMWNDTVNMGIIANFHTLFNLVNCVMLLPCIGLLIKLAKKVIKDGPLTMMEQELSMLDKLFINNPSIALEQCKKVMRAMAKAVKENYGLSSKMLTDFKENDIEKILENEAFLDKTETVLGDYLVSITEQHLTNEQNRLATEMMHTVGDFERIGDHCTNLLEVAQYNANEGIEFSETAKNELTYITNAVGDILGLTVDAYQNDTEQVCHKVRPMEDTIDDLVALLKSKHIERLKHGRCTTQSGISWIEVLTNMERIADHCNNISTHLHQRINHSSLDMHLDKIFDKNSEEYQAMYLYYKNMYCKPIE